MHRQRPYNLVYCLCMGIQGTCIERKIIMRKIWKRILACIMIIGVVFINTSMAYAMENDNLTMKTVEYEKIAYSENEIIPMGTETFTLGSSGGNVTFEDSAYIAIRNVPAFSTIKVLLWGNDDTEYRVWFRNTDTIHYINADSSWCTKYTLFGGTIYIQIDPYNGESREITAEITL